MRIRQTNGVLKRANCSCGEMKIWYQISFLPPEYDSESCRGYSLTVNYVR